MQGSSPIYYHFQRLFRRCYEPLLAAALLGTVAVTVAGQPQAPSDAAWTNRATAVGRGQVNAMGVARMPGINATPAHCGNTFSSTVVITR